MLQFVLAASFLTLTTLAAAQSLPIAASAPEQEVAALQQDQTNPEEESASRTKAESHNDGVSVKSLVPNIVRDQKPIWSFPFRVLEGKHLKPTLAIVAATTLLVALDPHDEPYFRNNSGFNAYKTGPLRARNTTLAITFFPVATFIDGLVVKDSYTKKTGLLAGEAIADTQIVSLVMKAIDGRLHPSDIPPHGDFTHTWFKYPGSVFNPGSFPSNHAASAFAVAKIFSSRYREHRWVPWVAYGLAGAISLSRVPDQAHFPSDVFAGAAIGYGVGNFLILKRGD